MSKKLSRQKRKNPTKFQESESSLQGHKSRRLSIESFNSTSTQPNLLMNKSNGADLINSTTTPQKHPKPILEVNAFCSYMELELNAISSNPEVFCVTKHKIFEVIYTAQKEIFRSVQKNNDLKIDQTICTTQSIKNNSSSPSSTSAVDPTPVTNNVSSLSPPKVHFYKFKPKENSSRSPSSSSDSNCSSSSSSSSANSLNSKSNSSIKSAHDQPIYSSSPCHQMNYPGCPSSPKYSPTSPSCSISTSNSHSAQDDFKKFDTTHELSFVKSDEKNSLNLEPTEGLLETENILFVCSYCKRYIEFCHFCSQCIPNVIICDICEKIRLHPHVLTKKGVGLDKDFFHINMLLRVEFKEAERLFSLRFLRSVCHARVCSRKNCQQMGCQQMKEQLTHFSDCFLPRCYICERLKVLCCNNTLKMAGCCPGPFCTEVREIKRDASILNAAYISHIKENFQNQVSSLQMLLTCCVCKHSLSLPSSVCLYAHIVCRECLALNKGNGGCILCDNAIDKAFTMVVNVLSIVKMW